MSTEIKNEKKFAIVLGMIMVIAIIAAFAAGTMYGEQKTEKKYQLLLFEVTTFADHQPVEIENHKMRMDNTLMLFDLGEGSYKKDNITMIGIKVHPYPQAFLDMEKAKKIANEKAEAEEEAEKNLPTR